MFKKLFALVLTVSMLLTMTYIPAAAQNFSDSDLLPGGWLGFPFEPWSITGADDGVRTFATLAEAVEAAEDGEKIVLNKNVVETLPVEVDKNVTINGNGFTVSFVGDGIIVSAGTLTLSADLSVEASGVALTVVGGEVVTFANLKSTGGAPAIAVGDELTAGTVTVNGGNIVSDEGTACITCTDGSSLTIIGGTFSSNPGDEYCQNGYKFEENDEGMFVIVERVVAKIGSKAYKSFAEAIAAVKDNETVELLADINEAGPFAISANNVTVKGNGYTINCESGFAVNGGSLTLSDDLTVVATVEAALSVNGGSVLSYANLSGEAAAFLYDANGNGTLVIKGGVLSSDPGIHLAPGYKFENIDGKFEVIKNEAIVAIVGNAPHESFAEALRAVNREGGILLLNQDVSVEGAINVLPGATIDLNGYVLGTEYITVYGGAGIIDGSADNSGLLKCKKENVVIKSDVTIQNKEIKGGLPVWDEANGGYMFAAYTIMGVDLVKNDDGKLSYRFAFLTNARARALITNAEDDLSITARVTWEKGETTFYEDVYFGQSDVSIVVGQTQNKGFAVTLSNYESFENIQFQARVVSGSGFVVHTDAVNPPSTNPAE